MDVMMVAQRAVYLVPLMVCFWVAMLADTKVLKLDNLLVYNLVNLSDNSLACVLAPSGVVSLVVQKGFLLVKRMVVLKDLIKVVKMVVRKAHERVAWLVDLMVGMSAFLMAEMTAKMMVVSLDLPKVEQTVVVKAVLTADLMVGLMAHLMVA